MPADEQDWINHHNARDIIFQKTVQAIKEGLANRPRGPRDHAKDDALFGPLSDAMVIAAHRGDPSLAIRLFHECYPLALEHERQTGSVLHKGAPAFNAGVAYLQSYDFTAAMHYFEVAQQETRLSYGEPNFGVFEFGLFDQVFWRTVEAAATRYPNAAYQELWGRPLDSATARADWKNLSDASKLPYVIATAQRIRYWQLAELSNWDASESLRLARWVLVADLARLVETEARRRSTASANTLLATLSQGFKRVRLGDLSARIQDWHDNHYKVKSGPEYNAQFPAIRSTILDRSRPEVERVGHAVYLLGVTRNQVAHSVDPSVILYQDANAARFTTDVLLALCNLDGWAR